MRIEQEHILLSHRGEDLRDRLRGRVPIERSAGRLLLQIEITPLRRRVAAPCNRYLKLKFGYDLEPECLIESRLVGEQDARLETLAFSQPNARVISPGTIRAAKLGRTAPD